MSNTGGSRRITRSAPLARALPMTPRVPRPDKGPLLPPQPRPAKPCKVTRQLVTRTMEQIDPELPAYGVITMNELISNSMARRRLALFLMSTFAGLALFLASMGIYGVTAFLVKQRVQEFGIRMALGVQIRDILVLAVRPGLVLVSIGAAVGLVVSMFITRLMSSLLFAVSSTDLLTFITVPLVLAVVAVIACLIPARYAVRISPAEALRH